MIRRIYIAAWVAWGLLAVSVPVLAIVAIWTESDRLGGVAGVLFGTGLLAGLSMAFWADNPPPTNPPRLPRAQRRRLRDEQARIELERRIAEAEREAGIE